MNQASSFSKTISPEDLICMSDYVWEHPIAIKLEYAQENNLLFGEQIYKTGAKLWLYKDLAKIVIEASQRVYKETGGTLVLYDGLRVTDAQAKMLETQRVKDNPQWLEAPRLLSPPGQGGHPRGMAVDVSIMKEGGEMLDMGTEFDFLAEDPSMSKNPAHRFYPHPDEVKENRKILNVAMIGAATKFGMRINPLPQEWWDYRLPDDVYNEYAPLSDADLPEFMRLME